MGKLAVGATQAAIVIIKPARNTVPFVVPIARVRYRLEFDLGFV